MGIFDDPTANGVQPPRPRTDLSLPTTAVRDALPPQATGPEPEVQDQRHANFIEQLLDLLSTGNYAGAGAADAALQGHNPLKGAVQGVQQHTTYKDVIHNQLARLPEDIRTALYNQPVPGTAPSPSIGGAVEAAGGLAGDIALDPITYAGGGLTKTGEAAKAAEVEYKLAKMSGDFARVKPARQALLDAGRLGTTATERVQRGQEGLQMFGRRVLPKAVEAPIAQAGENLLARAGDLPVAQELRKKFVTMPSLTGIDREVMMARKQEVETLASRADARSAAQLGPIAKDVYRIAREHKVNATELEKQLADAVERSGQTAPEIAQAVDQALAIFGPQTANDLSQPVRDLVSRVNVMNAMNLAREKKAGFPIEALKGPINYLHHHVRPEARDLLEQFGGRDFKGIVRDLSTRHRAQLDRMFTGQTINEVNDLAEQGKLEALGYQKLPGGIFTTNPFITQTLRNRMAAEAVGTARFLRDAGRVYGKYDIGELGERIARASRDGDHATASRLQTLLGHVQGDVRMQAPPAWAKVATDLPGFEGLRVPQPIADVLNAHHEGVANPGSFMRSYDYLQGVFKKYALGVNPVYHTRNEIGDLWNAIVIGGANPLHIAKGPLTLAANDRKVIFEAGGHAYTARELKAMAARHGVTDTGQIANAIDVMNAIKRAPRNGLERAKNALADNKALDIAQAVGNFRENSTRMGMFIDRLSKGMSPERAALDVKKHLFDYGQLTQFERSIMRRIMPFYSYTRLNAPLQISALFRTPGKFAGLEKVRNAAAGTQGTDDLGLDSGVPLPGYLRSGLPLRMWNGAEGNPQFARLEGLLPASDIEMLDPRAAADKAINLLSPLLTTPAEMATNIDLFKSDPMRGEFEPLEQFPGERSNLLGLAVPHRWVAQPLSPFRPINELSKLNPGGIFGDSENGAPWLPENLTTPRPGAQLSQGDRLINFLLGRLYPVDPDRVEGGFQNKVDREIARLTRELEKAQRDNDNTNATLIERRIEALQDNPNLIEQ